ncbi:unnamed protein product [Macrosiphum euphorbiae]|uniref:Uncharacterized protein n=1 Tax=Macrosiphum euphorbiae TaxID=13131 RepID=A0AAV0X496_9HEMI|nr:unnamed protein product [Macrosiphum euphorbiae]
MSDITRGYHLVNPVDKDIYRPMCWNAADRTIDFVAMLQESCTRDRTGRRSWVGALERRGPESVSSLDRTIN